MTLLNKVGHFLTVQVAEWARQRFYEETAKPDEHITLAKACMLIALEDEAAAVVDEQESRARTSRIVDNFVGGNMGNETHLYPPRCVPGPHSSCIPLHSSFAHKECCRALAGVENVSRRCFGRRACLCTGRLAAHLLGA